MQARTIIAAVAAILLTAGMVQATDVFNMDPGLTSLSFVTVGNPGNAPDVNLDFNGNPLGSVGYAYQMGQYDVTAAQYCQFLNAVATQSDPYGLYDPSMALQPAPHGDVGCGIVQTGNPGNYSYYISSAGFTVNNGNFPVGSVTWGTAVRFCNWLTNGQPATGVEDLTTTENGSYYINGAMTNAALMAVTRNANARYVIPTENEWYKAAYYDPTLNGGAGGYWRYPTRSNTTPDWVLSSTGTNNANYRLYPDYIYTDPTNYLTEVGTFAGSPGPYGTYDMGGDVWQWNEGIISGDRRGLRGGSFENGDTMMLAENYGGNPPETGYGGEGIGFRVVELPVPEPLTILALGMAIAGLGGYIRRRRGAVE